ncbi:acyltransferase family protein [Leucobacter sp. BZR 635]
MRTIAVGLVVIYHVWPNSITGGFVGVDVFLVISGFLITSHLLKKPPRSFKDFTDFWARRIRRLLPASLLVLLVTVIATRLLAAETAWANLGKQVVASALYVQNWALAIANVDYLAAENAPTPVQHYWSLSVEEQFYLFWPLAIAFLIWLATRIRKSSDTALLVGMVAIIVASLTYSVYSTYTNPGWAYFATTARIWELAIGGLTALLVSRPWFRIGAVPGIVMAWAGVVGILITAVTFDGSTPFPGYSALLPVVSTALIILAASTHRYSPNIFLSLRPMQFLGGISFSVYLWHWPLLVLLPYVSGELGWVDNVFIVVATILLASLTKTFVEDRFRFGGASSDTRAAYRFAAFGMAIVVLAGSALVFESHTKTRIAQEQASNALASGDPCFGAAAMATGLEKCGPPDVDSLQLPPTAAATDKSDAYADNCWSSQPYTEKPVCNYGSGEKRVALVGNSHAGHWLPALQGVADAQGWTIDTYLIDRCNPTTVKLEFDAKVKADNCLAYGEWVLEKTTASGEYDMVITSERQSLPVAGATWEETEDLATEAYKSYLQQWADAGVKVVVIKDPPTPGGTVDSIPDCIATHPDELNMCSATKEEWHWMDPLMDAAVEMQSPLVKTVNFDDYFCDPTGQCLPIVGSVITYFDASHITATYARTISPFLNEQLNALQWENG